MALVERRIGALFAVFLVLLLLAMARSAWLGTVDGQDLKSRAVAQQVEDVTVAARRGTITDRNGVELAVSENSITVYADPRVVKDPGGTASRLAPFLGRPYQDLLTKLSDRSKGFVYLARKLPLAKGTLVQKLKIPGIGTTEEPRRVYPQGTLAGQLLGSVGVDNYGLSGIEQSLETKLHGKDGKRRIVNDALGKPVSIVDSKRAEAGQDVQLTIDANIQERVESVLAGRGPDLQAEGRHRARARPPQRLDPRARELAAGRPLEARRARLPDAEPRRAVELRARLDVQGVHGGGRARGEADHARTRCSTCRSTLQVADRTIKDAEVRGPESLTRGADPGAVLERRRGEDRHAAGRDPLRQVGAPVRLRRLDRHRPARASRPGSC